jgi:glyoxylase-like metal-dependent hydrolase (beta-lactamase superfamily II)
VVIEYAPLEDELGDVLEKALRHRQLTEPALAARADVPLEKLHDAIDYRAGFTPEEVRRLAEALDLNELGLLALAQGRYPLPEICGLPFCLYPLRMAHGIGVANAYLVAECGASRALLFDTGPDHAALQRVWPKPLHTLDAVFLTHHETEHSGGLATLMREHAGTPAFGPDPPREPAPKITTLSDESRLRFGSFEVRTLRTPGHTEAHNCYVVSAPKLASAPALLISGDMLFAGSVGGAYFCQKRLTESLRRVLTELPATTVIAPGHGPLTTIKNEREFNPFIK